MYCEKNFFVSYCMSFSPVYVNETDTLLDAMEAMENFKVNNISVIDKNSTIIGFITKKKIKDVFKLNHYKNISLLKNFKVKDIISRDKMPIFFYPKMKVNDAFSFMKCFNNTCIPVVNEPWEKKMVGVVWLEDILSVIKELPA